MQSEYLITGYVDEAPEVEEDEIPEDEQDQDEANASLIHAAPPVEDDLEQARREVKRPSKAFLPAKRKGDAA